jgi:hypothetical protein
MAAKFLSKIAKKTPKGRSDKAILPEVRAQEAWMSSAVRKRSIIDICFNPVSIGSVFLREARGLFFGR